MELSTSIPIPRASPDSVITLMEIFKKYMPPIVLITQSGIDIPIIKVENIFLKNMNRIIIASIPPVMREDLTLSSTSSINSA
ncbi:MAG: hypothetical protein ACD_79C00782G0001 [uncultured bacterium]|nr:MAG: hypothetical protein ACD_79C00782G0001 [uncultured bacterium]